MSRSEKMLVLGATSGIARALSHVLARRGCRLILAGRDREELDRMAADLRVRYHVAAESMDFDALDFDGHPAFLQHCIERLEGQLDGVVLCYGQMAAQALTETSFSETRATLDVNLTSAISILNLAASHLEQQGRGFIAAISSVAGDRGRQSNYTYGAAKAGLSAYLQGLRNRLHRSGVSVLTIKPGFVDTSMTYGILNPSSPLVASPEMVARDIDRAIQRRLDVVYTPWFWWIVMGLIRSVPERVFKRLRL